MTYKCKCGSENTETTCNSGQPAEDNSWENLKNGNTMMTNCVYYTSTYKFKCNECGHTDEFTQ